MPDSELAVESRVKNPFTIDRFSGGKLLCVESFSRKSRVNSHVKARFRVIRSYALDSRLPSIQPEARFAIPHDDSETDRVVSLKSMTGTMNCCGYSIQILGGYWKVGFG